MIYISRATIVIPVIVIVTAIVIYGSQKLSPQSKTAPLPISPTPISPTVVSSRKIDLQGPTVCDYSDKTSSMSAKIRNNNVRMVNTENKVSTYYILNGDCFYSWIGTQKTGVKTCGLSQLISLSTMLGGIDSSSIKTLSSMLSTTSIASEAAQFDQKKIDSLIQTCKTREVKPSELEVPTSIVFTEKKK